MNAENTTKLLTAYPLLYRNLREWGFECGDGWFDLVNQLSADIESAARLAGTAETSDAWPSVEILKEKGGCLRLSFADSIMMQQGFFSIASGDPVDEYIRALVETAVARSMLICENCGAPGTRLCSYRRWYKTLCINCRNAQPQWQATNPEAYAKKINKQLPVYLIERESRVVAIFRNFEMDPSDFRREKLSGYNTIGGPRWSCVRHRLCTLLYKIYRALRHWLPKMT